MPIVSYAQPVAHAAGLIHQPNTERAISTWINPNAGLIAGPEVPRPDAPTPMEQTIMDIHVLTGPKHSEAGQISGHFLKTTGPAAFSFQPHGLGPTDVGALPVAGQAADSDKLDGNHASAFLGASATAVDSDKLDGSHATAFEPAIAVGSGDRYFAQDKTWKFLDHLCASDGSPSPALSVDATGQIGIGASPTRPLTVSAPATVLANFVSNYGTSFVDIDNTAADGDPGVRLLLSGSTAWNIGVDDSDADKLKIGTSALVDGAPKLTIDKTGKVGILNTAPAATLDVTGSIQASTTLTLPAMSSAGLVRNSAAGLLSGGNTVAAADLDTEIGNHTSATFNIPRYRGEGSVFPTGPRYGDLFFHTVLGISIYGTDDTWHSAGIPT
jgi:hypothetical protein